MTVYAGATAEVPPPGERAMKAAAASATHSADPASVDRLARQHTENFAVLSPLVPTRLRPAFAAVYAFCRCSDDLADETIPGIDPGSRLAREAALQRLAHWRDELNACLDFAQGRSDQTPRPAVFQRLAETVREHRLDASLFHRLLDAFERDQRQTSYRTWDDLLSYCRCSADPVGRLVLGLGGIDHRDPAHAEIVARSDAVCTALQLTNHWQDARRDVLTRRRVYLPMDAMDADLETLTRWASNPADSAARVAYIRRLRPLIERTQTLYLSAAELPTMLRDTSAGDLAGPVWLFREGGLRTLNLIERHGCTTLWKRRTLTRSARLLLVLQARLRFGGGGR